MASNLSKQCVWSPGGAAALAALAARVGLRGTPHAPPQPEKGYAGGELPGIKVLGAYLGEDEWCSAQLCKRVRQALKPLDGIVQLEDAPKLGVASVCDRTLLWGHFGSDGTPRGTPPPETWDAGTDIPTTLRVSSGATSN